MTGINEYKNPTTMDSEEVLTEKYKWWFLSFNKSSQYWQLRQVCREGIALEKTNSIFEIYTNGKWSNQSKSLIWASFPFLLYFQDWESDKFYEVGCNDTIVLILCSWWRLNLCIKPQYKKKCDRIICRNWNIILMVVHCRNSQLRRTSLI